MKYCVRYSRKFNYIDKVDEFKIVYKPKDDTLIYFLSQFPDKRIIISMTEEDIENIILSGAFKEKYALLENKNFAFLLPVITDENKTTISLFIKELKSNNIQYFINEKIYSIDKVWELIDLGVSDVYICGELGFELKSISQKIHQAGINIRVFPDVAQSTRASGDPVTKFYIRPDDILKYNEYIDICEFFADDKIRDNLLYQVYAKEHHWYLNINDIILGFEDYEPISNISFPNQFGIIRSNCQKRCLKDNNCDLCHRCFNLSKICEENGVVLKENLVTKEEYDADKDFN